MEWSAHLAALDLHRGLDVTETSRHTLATFAEALQAAYMRGRSDAIDQLEGAQPLSAQQAAALCADDAVQEWERCARMGCRRKPKHRRDTLAYCWQHAGAYDADRACVLASRPAP